MIITSAKYQNIYVEGSVEETNHNIKAIIDGTTYSVPMDPENRHYAEILKQVEEGLLTIEEAD